MEREGKGGKEGGREIYCIYIWIYIHREGERERKRVREKGEV